MGAQSPVNDEAWQHLLASERHVNVVRVTDSPKIDGRLDDPAWKLAADPGPLIQSIPDEGAPPTERTEFRVLYDNEYLYVGIWCYDSEPDKIVAREMKRDGSFGKDDNAGFAIDPFYDQRNGYWFRVNPLGGRYDALISNNTGFTSSWDGIWFAKTSIDEEGWKAEIAIPFKTISFNPKTASWGFNIFRTLKRRSETSRWSGYQSEFSTFYMAEAGTITGLSGIQQGIGLDVKPYVLGRYSLEREPRRDDDYDYEMGTDVRYRVAPNLTANVSVNTDFAETEVDARQINLTRFPLFFPEKRDFFLEDAGIFDFGNLSSSDFLPFFSRRIGLSADGEPVPIIAAGKLTGRVNDYNIGVLDAVLESRDGLGTENALVTRVSKNVFKQSQVGVIGTIGDPNSNEENFVGGADLGLRTTELFGDQTLEFDAFVVGSHTTGMPENDDPVAIGGQVRMPNDEYRLLLEMFQVGEDFDAALGFVPRRGIRSYQLYLGYRPQPESIESIRRFNFDYSTQYVTDLDNRLDTVQHEVRPLTIVFESLDQLTLDIDHQLDAPIEEFEISDGVIIPADEYWFTDFAIDFDSATKRPVSFDVGYETGEFYDGWRDRYKFGVDVNAIKWVLVGVRYRINVVRLPQGDFETRISAVRLGVNFNPDLAWSNLIQYDSVSDTIGLNSRIQWEVHPGTRLFIVLNQNTARNHGSPYVLDTALAVKLGVTLRF